MSETPPHDAKASAYAPPAELQAPQWTFNDHHRERFESIFALITERFTDPKKPLGFPNNVEKLAELKNELSGPLAYYMQQEEMHPFFNFTENRTFVRNFVKCAEACIVSIQAMPRTAQVEVSKRIPFSYGQTPLKELEQSMEVLQTFIEAGKRFASETIESGPQPRPYIEVTMIALAKVFESWTEQKFVPRRETAIGFDGPEFVNSGPLFIQEIFKALQPDLKIEKIRSVLGNFKKVSARVRP